MLDTRKLAEDLKSEGNRLFQKHKLGAAIEVHSHHDQTTSLFYTC